MGVGRFGFLANVILLRAFVGHMIPRADVACVFKFTIISGTRSILKAETNLLCFTGLEDGIKFPP